MPQSVAGRFQVSRLAFELLESRTLLSADVGLRYAFVLDGAQVSALEVGKTYVLDAYIRDNRDSFGCNGGLAGLFQREFFQ